MKPVFAAFALIVAAAPASAHHPLEGAPMTGFGDGLLSGIGHPILGADHLVFVIAAGIAAFCAGSRLRAPLAYVAAMLAGCVAAGFWGMPPLVEPMIALSLAAVGGALALGRRLSPGVVAALFAVFGVFHGAAFGAPLIEQEAAAGGAVLGGYLLGLGATQYAIAAGAAMLSARLWSAAPEGAVGPRLAGAMALGAGIYLSLGMAMDALVV